MSSVFLSGASKKRGGCGGGGEAQRQGELEKAIRAEPDRGLIREYDWL